ncbi:MAG TPA: hydantoinase B/oxoprolinase family protein [Usitatibacteraceae bacterium]|nr:hydantoinase B/oxoprolinase family protein [Usitatibacteraceae bacterium]
MPRNLDAVEVELLWKRLVTAVDEAATALVRTAFSSVIRDFHDYACAVFDTRGRLLAQSTHSTPGLLGILPYTIPNFMRNAGFLAARPGDVFITNDPWLASGHLIDITVAMPVFRGDAVAGYVLTVVHHLNVGGRAASLESRDVYEEGLKIPILHLVRAGREDESVVAFIQANVREPDKVLGDVRAQVAASHAAATRLLETMTLAGLDSLEGLGDEIIGRSEASMREAIRALPDGDYPASMVLEDVAGYPEPLALALRVRIAGDAIALDYAGTSRQIPRAVNVTLNMTRSYSVYPLKCLLDPEVPNNAGCMRPIAIDAPAGSLLNASFPAPTWGRTIVAHMLPELVMQALAGAIPERLVAGSGSTPLLYGNFMGRRAGGESFYAVVTFNGGLGARGTRDGIGSLSYPANVASIPVEVIEHEAPLRFERKAFVADSAGAGRHRGGMGQRIAIRVPREAALDGPVVASIRGGRFGVPVYPLGGGLGAGQPTICVNGRGQPFGKPFELHPGDEVVLDVPGGGGYGPPRERPAAAVLADVRNGLVSPGAAISTYGLDPAALPRAGVGAPD